MTEQSNETVLVQAAPAALQLSEQAIETIKHNIQLCEQLVGEVLERDIDFGTIPGVPQPFLWDSGAAKIMAAFNCYANYKVIDAADQVPHVRYTIASLLINRQTGMVVATGIGAASTKEIKHRYRWAEDPEKEGISRKGLKQRNIARQGAPEKIQYRIPNPEPEDLLNTIAKMAAKRADIDAAQSLPGVAATLRKLFQSKPQQPPPKTTTTPTQPQPQDKPSWAWFESKLAALGVSHQEAKDILHVNSIAADWIGVQGRTLAEAYEVIKDAVGLTRAGKQADLEFERRKAAAAAAAPETHKKTEEEELWPT